VYRHNFSFALRIYIIISILSLSSVVVHTQEFTRNWVNHVQGRSKLGNWVGSSQPSLHRFAHPSDQTEVLQLMINDGEKSL